MLNKIIDVLKKNNIKNWRVSEVVSQTAELYFIKKKLDIPRFKDLVQYSLTIYVDGEKNGEKLRGDSSAVIYPGMSEEEIDSKVKSVALAASYSLNKYYELANPVNEAKKASLSNMCKKEPKEVALAFAKAAFSVDNAEDAFINSLEIFANKRSIHILTSNGTDVSYDANSVLGEFVTQCTRPIDVEQYRLFDFDNFDEEIIKSKVSSAIEDVRARANASRAPKAGNYDIILKDEHIAEILNFFAARASASMIYPGYSTWKVGDNVQGKLEGGEAINIDLMPSEPYSAEGIPMKQRKLVEDGTLELIYGSTRFSRYLGIEPTGDYGKLWLKNGTIPISEMRKEGVLEPVSFSDFQMDYMDGHFKGEIRLAHLYKADGTVEELTGGSINGNFIELQKKVVFSKEQYEDTGYKGPLAIFIPGVAVAGE